MRTFKEYIEEGRRWDAFMKMMADFHSVKNIDTDLKTLSSTADWAARRVDDAATKKKLKDFAIEIAKADLSKLAGRKAVAKLEKDVAPILKALNATIKFESMKEGYVPWVREIPKMTDDQLVKLWKQAEDEMVGPQFGNMLKKIRMEIKKRKLKV